MDPYKILEVPKVVTKKQLKEAYKKMVIKYHPDLSSNIKTTPIFQALTSAYKMILADIEKNESEPLHYELKARHKKSIEENKGIVGPIVDINKKFDVNRFNELFESNKFKDDYIENGYEDWLNQDTKDNQNVERAIVNYKEPEAIESGLASKFYSLGVNKVSDYSNYNSSLQFMDLKKALTTTRIVDESKVEKIPEFKSLKDIKKHRENIEYTMSPEEMTEYQKRIHKMKIKEEKRLKKQQEKDNMIEKHYEKTNELLLKHMR
jgi:curved DNA-binding protein CbpA